MVSISFPATLDPVGYAERVNRSGKPGSRDGLSANVSGDIAARSRWMTARRVLHDAFSRKKSPERGLLAEGRLRSEPAVFIVGRGGKIVRPTLSGVLFTCDFSSSHIYRPVSEARGKLPHLHTITRGEEVLQRSTCYSRLRISMLEPEYHDTSVYA